MINQLRLYVTWKRGISFRTFVSRHCKQLQTARFCTIWGEARAKNSFFFSACCPYRCDKAEPISIAADDDRWSRKPISITHASRLRCFWASFSTERIFDDLLGSSQAMSRLKIASKPSSWILRSRGPNSWKAENSLQVVITQNHHSNSCKIIEKKQTTFTPDFWKKRDYMHGLSAWDL